MKLLPAMQRTSRSVFAAVTFLLIHHSCGDLGAAVRRREQSGGVDAPTAPPTGPVVVKLQKVEPRPVGDPTWHTKDSFYVGNISVGHPPQMLQVLFDTASGLLLLPHRACKSHACLEHRRYSPWESSTAMDVNTDGGEVQKGSRLAKGRVKRTVVTVEFTQADLGSGNARGVLVKDNVCLNSATRHEQACASLSVLAGLRLDDKPFRAMPHDGILGLALEGLAGSALSSFYERLMDSSHQFLPQFGLFLGPTSGEIVFGGHDFSRVAAPLRWLPVERPQDGFWQVAIQEVRIGNTTVDGCQAGCRGIIDTGSSSLGVMPDGMRKLMPGLKTASLRGGACEGPRLELDLGGFVLALEAEDYTGTSCNPELGLLGLDAKEFRGVYALGTSVIHRYYTGPEPEAVAQQAVIV